MTGARPLIPRSSDTPIVAMTRAMTPSSTRHAPGRAKTGASSRAPKPSAVNQTTLATIAPAPNSHRVASALPTVAPLAWAAA